MNTDMNRQMWVASPMAQGDDVLAIQQRLRAIGLNVDTDGLYGRATESAVIQFQRRSGLAADGIVGVATWSRLFPGAPVSQIAVADLGGGAILTPAVLTELKTQHDRYKDGCSWSLTAQGILIQNRDGGDPADTPSAAERELAAQVLRNFAQPLASALTAQKANVPIELVVACICTESSGVAGALRREPGCDTADPARTPSRVSCGLMQTLLSTARTALGNPDLSLDALADPQKSIGAGAAYIFLQARETRFDPPLVAAAYNAGGLYYEGTPANRWRLRQYPIGTPNHVDRFVRFFNAALTAVDPSTLPASVPSFKRLLTIPAG